MAGRGLLEVELESTDARRVLCYAMLCYGRNSSSLGQDRTRTSYRYEDATVTARPVPRGGQLELYIPQGRLLKQADIA